MVGRYVIYYNTREGQAVRKLDYSALTQINLCEVVVNDNLAYQKPTWQTREKYSSAKAVDGLFETSSGGRDQCAMSYKSATDVMWMVDLEDIYSIYQVVIYHKTGGVSFDKSSDFTKKLLGFSIIVSNTTDRRDGVVCYQDTQYTASTIPDKVEIFCSVIGRFVFYYNERLPGIRYPKDYSKYAYGDLCEIEVSGCPVAEFGYENADCTIPCLAMCHKYLENLSYRKPTWQSYTYAEFGSSDKAVDGKKSRHYRDGCPSPVAEVPECSKPCPSNCETCYPNTGFCTKCKPGFEGSACDVVCDAIGRAGIANDGFYNGSFTDMFTSEGHTFLPTEHGFARLILTLSGKSSNVAKLSFTIHKASNVFVAFVNSTNEYTVMHFDQYTKTQHWEVNVINEFMSKVHLIRITVQFKIPFTISNLRLPLRACFRNDSDISEMFAFFSNIGLMVFTA
uniref:Uncharacterized protein n=1 Tax=Magallana gigas TaxID=29159 RepID=K1RB57_MAGGI